MSGEAVYVSIDWRCNWVNDQIFSEQILMTCPIIGRSSNKKVNMFGLVLF